MEIVNNVIILLVELVKLTILLVLLHAIIPVKLVFQVVCVILVN